MANHELTPFLDEIRNRLKLSDLIARSTKVFKKGKTVKALCPFHNEKTPSFGIDDARGFYHCFGCGASGDHFKFVQEIQNLNFIESVRQLADELGIKLPEKEASKISQQNEVICNVLEAACVWYQEQLQRSTGEGARTYLNNRQVTQASIDQFRLGFAPNQGLIAYLKDKKFSQGDIASAGLSLKADDGHFYDRFRNRLIFPITNARGQVIAFGGRILEKGEPKYLNSPETPVFQKRYVLYGLQQARRYLRNKAIIVEGYMDVIRLHQEGIPFAVAPLGTSLGIEHLQQIWRHAPCPIIAFDGDSAGEKAAFSTIEKSLPLLSANQTLKFLFLPSGEDPDSYVKSYGSTAFEKLLSTTHPIYTILWQNVTKNFSLDNLTPEEFLQIKGLLKEHLKNVENIELRKAYFRQFDILLNSIQKQERLPFRKKQISLPQQNSIATEKILLVTLLNHPYLWEEIGELLMGVNFKDPEIEAHRLNLIEYFSGDFHNEDGQKALPAELSYLKNFTDERFYSRVPFAKIGYDEKMAKNGWLEMYNKLHNQQFLHNDQQQSAEHLKNDFSLSNWERLKAIKER